MLMGRIWMVAGVALLGVLVAESSGTAVLAAMAGVVMGGVGWEWLRQRRPFSSDKPTQSTEERHLQAIIEAEPECVKMVSADGSLLQMNPAGLRLIESPDFESVDGADVFSLVHPDSLDDFKEMHAAVLAGETRGLRFRIIGLQGTHRWMETTAVPFTLSRGEVVHLAITRDITRHVQREADLAAAREAAEAASRTKSTFLANMSHEIRTPLTAIIGFADVALRSDDPGLKADALRTIRENGKHLNAVLGDVLDLSKIESGQLDVEQIPTDIRGIVREVHDLCAARAGARGIHLSVEVPELPLVQSDPVRIRQILLNLVANAIKFTEAGGVTVRVAHTPLEDQLEVRISVEDTGIGMSADQLERVFEPFQQADASMSRRFGGTGLGLSISARLARQLGGALRARSNAGQGCTMTLVLSPPLAPAPPPAVTEAAVPTLHGLRVLLAEDNAVNAQLVTLMLGELGAAVVHAGDGAAAIDVLERSDRPFDVVLMDMQMPGIDGYEATRRLRSAGRTVPIIALTAHSMSGDRARCLGAGCDDYLTKPIDWNHLARTCARWAGSEEPAGAA